MTTGKLKPGEEPKRLSQAELERRRFKFSWWCYKTRQLSESTVERDDEGRGGRLNG